MLAHLKDDACSPSCNEISNIFPDQLFFNAADHAPAHLNTQARRKATVKRKERRKKQLNAAATCIQAHERGRQAREKARREEAARRLAAAIEERKMNRAAVNIQCLVRQRFAHQVMLRRKLQVAAQERRRIAAQKKAAAITIQRVTRGWLVRGALAKAAAERAQIKADAAAAAAATAAALAAADASNAGRRVSQWRKKSVVGGRAVDQRARLSIVAQQVQVFD